MTDALTEALAQLQTQAEERRRRPTQPAPQGNEPQQSAVTPPPSARPETRPNSSPFDLLRHLHPANSLGSSVGADILRGDGTVTNPVLRGVARGINETADLAAEVGTAIGDWVEDNGNVNAPGLAGSASRGVRFFGDALGRIGFSRNEAPDLPAGRPEDADLGDRLVEGLSQTITGFFVGGRVLRALRVPAATGLASGFLRSSAQGAVGDFIAFDGNDERLSNLIESVPQLRNPITEFLAADADDEELSGRFKNTLEGLGVGAFAEAFLWMLRGTRALRNGDRAGVEAAQENLERQVNNGATTERVARETAQAAQQRALDETPQPGLVERVVAEVRDRLGFSASRPASGLNEAQAIETLRQEAAQRAAAEVDVTGMNARDAEAARLAASTRASAAAEQEFRRLQQASQAEASSPRGSSEPSNAGTTGTIRPETPPRQAEVPEGVLSSREDVDALLEDAAFNRFNDTNNIKPGTDPALTRQHGEWTLNTFGTPENLDATLRALVSRTAPIARKTDDALHQNTLADAAALGQTPQDALAIGAHIAGIAGDMDQAVNLMRLLWKRTAQDVDVHVGRNLTEASADEYANVVRSIHNALVFSNYMARVKSAMGRGLRVFQLPDADTYARTLAAENADNAATANRGINPLPQTREEVSDWLELWGLTRENPEARTALLEGSQALPDQWKYLRNSFANLFTANVLSGVPSIMLNVVGPSTVGALRTLEKGFGGAIAGMMPFIPAARRAELRSSARNSMIAYAQAMGDVKDVFGYALQSMREGRSILGGGGSVSDRASQFGPITEGMLRAEGNAGGFGYWAGNIVNMWPSAFSRLNNGLDEFSKRLSFLGEVRARALLEGAEQGLNGDDLARFVQGRVTSATDEVGAAVDDAMLREAERTTFTGSPGAEGSKARALSNLINDWRANTPEIRYVLPIFNVPANALGETLTRIPIFNFALAETRDALLGNRGAVEQAEAWGRTLLGAGFLTAGFYMTRSGMLTGAGPESPTDRRVWLMTHQPYSIRIGDEWVDYSRYDILGSLLGIPATVYDRTVNRRQDLGMFDMMTASAAALSEYFRDKAALQTVSDFLSFGDRGQSEQAFAHRFVGGVGGRLLVPNFVTQIGRQVAGDDTARVKTDAFAYMLDMMPFASATLDPQRNVWGEPIHRPKDSFFENIAPITLSAASVYADDPQTDELDRLYTATGYAAGVSQEDDISGGYYDAREVQLEDGHSLYDAIMRARLTVELDGLTLRQAMQELFDSADYADAVDGGAQRRANAFDQESRGYLVSNVFRAYHREAIHQVARESETAARYLAVTSIKRQGGARLDGYSAEDLAETRGLAEAMGIDLEAYIARARDE